MRGLIVGSVESTYVAAQAIAAATDWDLAAIVTLAPDLSARHSDYVDLAPLAEEAGAELIRVKRINDECSLRAIEAAEPDYVFVIGWSQICGPELMALAADRVIGYHPAALPRMRGRAAIPWTILNLEPITAGSLFWMDEGVDSGAILDQAFFHVACDEKAATLYQKHMQALRLMLGRSLPALASGTARREPQDERYATWTMRRTAHDGAVDWNRPAHDIERLVRAVGAPYPGAFTACGGERLIIWDAHATAAGERVSSVPGQIIQMSDGEFTVACADKSSLRVTAWEVQCGKGPRLQTVLGRAS